MAKGKELMTEPSWCKGCGYCVEFCPKKVLEIVHGKIVIKDASKCIFCRLCEMRCPDYAIWIREDED